MGRNGEPGGRWFAVAGGAGKSLMRAVIDTFDCLERNKVKASSDTLLVLHGRFGDVFDQVVGRWAAFTESERWEFPWSSDFVRWAWLTYRKSIGSKSHNEIRSWVGIGSGADPGLFGDEELSPGF